MKIEAIDLFCGIGGLSTGLAKAGIKIVAGLDSEKDCQEIFEKNISGVFLHADIRKYDLAKLSSFYNRNSCKMLVGCAPCQPFSGYANNKNEKTDERWNLINYFLKAIKILKPTIVSMENVQGLLRTQIFQDFQNKLKEWNYYVNTQIVQCADYGVPQKRKRLILLASKLGPIKLIEPILNQTKYKTVKETIGHLPFLKNGEKNKADELHYARKLSALNLKRIRNSKPKGTWKDWDYQLIANCHKRQTQKSFLHVYGRMSWDLPSPTLTTQFTNYGSGRFGHPEQDRAISLREGALLQTFPKNYKFGENIYLTKIGRYIGNAVPPQLGCIIGETIKKHLMNFSSKRAK